MQKPWCLEMEWDMINIYTVVDFTGGVFPEAYEAQKTVYEYFDSKDEANDRIYELKLRTNLPYYTRTFKLSHQNQWEEVNNPFFFNESTSSAKVFFLKKREKKIRMYARCFYNVVSFVLFLICLTFPVEPTTLDIVKYNTWFQLLFDIVPIDVPWKQILQQLGYNAQRPFRTRKEMLDLLFAIHEKVFETPLHRADTLAFFESLRATDCKSEDAHMERGCNRVQQTPMVSVVHFHHDKNAKEFFKVDESMQHEHKFNFQKDDNIEQQCLQNKNSFCSCLFSPKWLLLHMVASQYAEQEASSDRIAKYEMWIRLFGDVSACFSCRENFKKNLQAIDFDAKNDLRTRYTLERFVFRLHDIVNRMLHQPAIAFHQMKLLYQTLQAQVTDDFGCTIAIASKHKYNKRYIID